MITLITGNPGAGKTLYCVANLLRDLCGSVVHSTDSQGRPVETPRIVYSNIPGLLLDHELIDGSDTGGLGNWHEWAKPGAVICYDEVQREWKPRANGSKVPKCIEALETHRHMGVDFILLTQHPGLLDQNIRALVGRHLHVRRFGGIGAAIVYEWDHCSRSLLYSKSLGKKTFRYSKDVFKLYKSAELHTKPKTTIPTLAFVVVGALAAAGFAIPYAASRVLDKSEQAAKASESKTTDTVKLSGQTRPALPTGDIAPPGQPVEVVNTEPEPPFPLGTMQLAGSLTYGKSEPNYLIRVAGKVVPHQNLMKAGYAFFPAGDCAVKVTYYSQTHFLLCDGVPPAPRPSPVAPPRPDAPPSQPRYLHTDAVGLPDSSPVASAVFDTRSGSHSVPRTMTMSQVRHHFPGS